jgi:hypothetical protein
LPPYIRDKRPEPRLARDRNAVCHLGSVVDARNKFGCGHLVAPQLSFASPDGRATFELVTVEGELRCRWRRVDDHSVLAGDTTEDLGPIR